MSTWYVYMLKCSDDTLYTGIAKDIAKRTYEHNHDDARGSRYTRVRRPVRLAYQEPAHSRSEATQRELQIRRLGKEQKEALVRKYARGQRSGCL
ncbi:MAG: GIY-YIG nuclease family protein [Gammaproteobacteria bacterium]|nr:MAG: GIY-YIG nuclease family protein [Gammaproteobacteria bacterium]